MRARSLAGLLIGSVAILVACGTSTPFTSTTDAGTNPDGGFPPGNGCKGGKICVGNDIHACDDDGKPAAKVGECTGKGEVCFEGACMKGCAATEAVTSNVGCEFWAVDLDNNKDQFNDAAGAPWGLAIANAGETPTEVVIEQNDAAQGAPPVVTVWKKIVVAPGALQVVAMPTREVDGSLKGQNEGPGTMLSSRAFRLSSLEPIVVYQFNALKSQYSNDASLLLPSPSLGQTYRALSWPSGKPISILGSPIDRGYLTIVGTKVATTVTVVVSQAVLAGGSIPATPKGGTIQVTLGPYDVLNLETDGMPGDLTGSIVTSSAPVSVFVGTELSGGVSAPLPPYPPNDPNPSSCCLDHLEEQLLPVESYGKKFTITRSPPRGTSYIEPDYIRFMGVAAAAVITTNLPPPDASFTIAPGATRDILVTKDFTVDASQPVAIGQVLVSQGYTESGIGDPSLTVLPAVEQFRQDYLFLVPSSWQKNYVVIAMPENTVVKIDGTAIGGECVAATIGALDGINYEARRCPIAEGTHAMTADKPFGVTAYGYGNAGSYAVVGGSNVKKIYVPPPIK
ncbi:hypothetical protein BH09MYX1_BH09MYX1_37930 [soil metagenome]